MRLSDIYLVASLCCLHGPPYFIPPMLLFILSSFPTCSAPLPPPPHPTLATPSAALCPPPLPHPIPYFPCLKQASPHHNSVFNFHASVCTLIHSIFRVVLCEQLLSTNDDGASGLAACQPFQSLLVVNVKLVLHGAPT